MGPLFALAFQLIVLLVFSSFISVVAGLSIYAKSRTKRKRKTFVAILLPHVILFSLYFVFLGGNIFMSYEKEVDIGIGDSWYVPLNSNCHLLMIDLTDQADIMRDGEYESLISGVTHAKMNGDSLWVRVHFGQPKLVMLSDGLIRTSSLSEEETMAMQKVSDFYRSQWWIVTGYLPYAVGALGLIVPSLLSFLIVKLVLYDWPS